MKKISKYVNKKTMIIAASLLAGISIIPATAVVLTSCSSTGTSGSSTIDITSTNFETKSSKASFLSDTFPTDLSIKWYKENPENQKTLKNFILNSVIQGKKNDITIENLEIVIPEIAPQANNNDGTIAITYTTNKYWENNQPITTKKNNDLLLTGLKSDKTTIVLSSYNIKDIFPEGNKKTASEFQTLLQNNYETQQAMKSAIADKILLKQIDTKDITLSLNNIKTDDIERTMFLSFSVSYYYDKGVVISETKTFETTFNQFGYVSTNFNNNSTMQCSVWLSYVGTTDLMTWESDTYFEDRILNEILETFTTGNKVGLATDDIKIKSVELTDVNQQAIIKYTFTKYWDYSGLVNAESSEISITCNGIGSDL